MVSQSEDESQWDPSGEHMFSHPNRLRRVCEFAEEGNQACEDFGNQGEHEEPSGWCDVVRCTVRHGDEDVDEDRCMEQRTNNK